jgi:hypothetical protein
VGVPRVFTGVALLVLLPRRKEGEEDEQTLNQNGE